MRATLIRTIMQRSMSSSELATLRVVGPNANGIVAACAQVLGRHGCGIVKSEQWTDQNDDQFFQRLAFTYNKDSSLPSSSLHNKMPPFDKQACEQDVEEVCRNRNLTYHLNWRDRKQRVGIMVSKYDHCLWELLLRHAAQESCPDVSIDVVISNHENLRSVADTFHIPYHVIPITPETRLEQEQKQLELLQDMDVVVLARYMQILSNEFLSHFPSRIINIHHSFLPAFMGSRPHHGAWERGVKLIGATAHYATEELDDGPIIEQDVIQVSHRDQVGDLIRKGQIIERNVLLRALEAHLDDRIIVYKNRCIVFGD